MNRRLQVRSFRPMLLAALGLALAWRPITAQGDEAARLLPADAVVLVRLESAQSWDELAQLFAPLAENGSSPPKLQSVLDLAASEEARDDSAGLPVLAPDQPLYLALALDPASGMRQTFVLPVKNGQPLRFTPAFSTGLEHRASLGGYQGVSTDPDYAASEAPSALVPALRPGILSVHVDLATLITTFRPLLDMGLQQAEMALQQMPTEGTPFDLEGLFEVYIDAARDCLDAAESLDLVLARNGPEIELSGAFVEREDSGSEHEVGELAPLLGRIDPESSIQMAFNGKWTDYLSGFEDFMDAALEIYPEPLRSDLQRVLDEQTELGPLLAPGAIAGVAFTPAGMHGAYLMRSTQPELLVDKLEAMLRIFDHEGGFVTCGPSEAFAVDGIEARTLSLEIRYEALLQMIEEQAGEDASLPPDQGQRMVDVLETLYGKHMRFGLGRRGELVIFSFGPDDSFLRADLARIALESAPSPRLQRLAGRLEPGSLGFVYHLDFGQAMGQITNSLRSFLAGGEVPPALSFSADFWGSLHGRTWSGGMSMEPAELIDMIRQLRSLEASER